MDEHVHKFIKKQQRQELINDILTGIIMVVLIIGSITLSVASYRFIVNGCA